jgi:CheY-like chemotaxis protein
MRAADQDQHVMSKKAGNDNKYRVLIVDDDEKIRELVQMTLGGARFETNLAANGAQALKIVDQWQPDLIMLDMRMPIMDGWQFVQAYRQMPPPHARTIILTAVLDAERIRQQVSADSVLLKPFTPNDILDAVMRFMPKL